jgi:hypothetical protein
MTFTDYGLDLNFSPRSYFWPLSLERHLRATIKGTKRRDVVDAAIATGRLDLVPVELLKPGMSAKDRQAIGRIHPTFMGGEYLPDIDECEVEIARIEIKSTTCDVTSVRARLDGDAIEYFVVDEYGGDTLSGLTACTAERPLTLKELFEFFVGAWSIFDVLENIFGDYGYDEDEMMDFIRPSSEFYPEFGKLCAQSVRDWGEAKRSQQGIGIE